jgi:hypothetical protein
MNCSRIIVIIVRFHLQCMSRILKDAASFRTMKGFNS